MARTDPLESSALGMWRTGNRITAFLIESLPEAVWVGSVPGYPRRTVRMIAGHLHNNRCAWIRRVGARHGLEPPAPVNRHRVTRQHLLEALEESSGAMVELFALGFRRGGKLPGFPLDTLHFIGYHLAHEAHHRGQIVMVARQSGQPLPPEVTNGLWFWGKRAREV